MKLILLSDIHGNLSALQSVIRDFSKKYNPDGIIILGDIINYGMRPNEVIQVIRDIPVPVIANISGNHEKAILDGDTSHFSTERGIRLLEHTRQILRPDSVDYIKKHCVPSGFLEFDADGKRILLVHGNAGDPYWGKIDEKDFSNTIYSNYEYVFSGHTHIPHLFEKFYNMENPGYRDRKRTIFINPGSVGQPRNHNPEAQYAYVDTVSEIFHFNATGYDISTEQSLYPDYLDSFYSTRLSNGI